LIAGGLLFPRRGNSVNSVPSCDSLKRQRLTHRLLCSQDGIELESAGRIALRHVFGAAVLVDARQDLKAAASHALRSVADLLDEKNHLRTGYVPDL
jgi:hypothetical protein